MTSFLAYQIAAVVVSWIAVALAVLILDTYLQLRRITKTRPTNPRHPRRPQMPTSGDTAKTHRPTHYARTGRKQ